MLRSLPSDSAARIRLLAKFVEKDYEKLDRLVIIRRELASKTSIVDRIIDRERASLPAGQDERADEWFSRRLDAGLFSLQVCVFPPTLSSWIWRTRSFFRDDCEATWMV